MRILSRLGFSNRVLLIVLLSLFLATIVITLLVRQVVQHETRQVLFSQQQTVADMVARRIGNALQERQRTLEILAGMLHDGERLLDVDVIQRDLDSRIQLHRFFNGGLVVLNSAGISIVDSPIVPGRTGIDFSDREHVRQVRLTGKTVITRPLIGRGLQAPVFVIDTPVVADSGEVLGFVFGVTRLSDDNLLKEIGQEAFGESADLLVVDQDLRLVVTASDAALAMQPLPVTGVNPVIDSVIAGQKSGFVVGHNGEELLFAASNLPKMGWKIIYIMPGSVTDKTAGQLLLKVAFPLSIFMIFVAILNWWLLRRQLLSLGRTVNTIDNMVAGSLPTHPLPVGRNDEIGRLIGAFNRLQERLAKHIAEVEQRNRDLQRLSEVSAHHLMEPSRRLLSYSRRLRSRLQNNPDQELMVELDFIDQSATRLRDLIRDMQHYLMATEIREPPRLLDMNQLLKEVLSELATKYPERYPLVGFNIDPLPPMLVDRPRMAELWSILLANALVHGTASQPSLIHISGEWRDGMCYYTISDNGPGIPEAYRERLFGIFERLKSTTSGTGIGLSIARRITESLNGEIRLEQSDAGGVEVILILPDAN